jgi:NAD(P)-dependent dehydrogenase (short-subunit alcohol dehydrogenase family)
MPLEGKVALVTGATGGMGSASARLFARDGAAVLVAARHKELADPVVQEITDAGGKALFVSLEVTEKEQWEAAVEKAKEQVGGLHILMNVVGSNELVMLPDVDLEAWNKVFEINVTATMMGMQTCAPLIRDSGGGAIVNIGSVGGLSETFSTAYSSSKWALEGLSRSAAYFCGASAAT